eukprot:TRINITY_DN58788_c0_g1_i1.p1 TRINITY_DN58788_c0_g1~~TRINITY_DN58788_c0_g1_i1.p1  ORF type:complete len:206 (+),score=52.11 TRINITY_DN58788_c0_g1_i1:124-741(+)
MCIRDSVLTDGMRHEGEDMGLKLGLEDSGGRGDLKKLLDEVVTDLVTAHVEQLLLISVEGEGLGDLLLLHGRDVGQDGAEDLVGDLHAGHIGDLLAKSEQELSTDKVVALLENGQDNVVGSVVDGESVGLGDDLLDGLSALGGRSVAKNGLKLAGGESAAGGQALRSVVEELQVLSLIHISEPTRLLSISYAVFCLKKKNKLENM